MKGFLKMMSFKDRVNIYFAMENILKGNLEKILLKEKAQLFIIIVKYFQVILKET